MWWAPGARALKRDTRVAWRARGAWERCRGGIPGPMPRLRRSDCSAPGLRRRRRGRGFEYLDADGARVDDPETLARIHTLAIPPAWTDVWICADPRGHLQATG